MTGASPTAVERRCAAPYLMVGQSILSSLWRTCSLVTVPNATGMVLRRGMDEETIAGDFLCRRESAMQRTEAMDIPPLKDWSMLWQGRLSGW